MKTRNTITTVAGAVCGLLLVGNNLQAQNLFVGDYASNSLLEFAGGTGTPTTFATGLNYPTGLAFDSSGDLFESDQFSGHIYEWAGAGGTRTTFASTLAQPGAMAFNAAGDLFVVVDGISVDEFSSAGVIINTITGFNSAENLAFDSAGNLYVSDRNSGGAGAGTIDKITTAGVQSVFASGLNYPVGMAFNAAGDLFVAGGNGFNTITEIATDGTQSTFASGLNGPTSIAFDTAGDMFVADGGLYGQDGDLTEFAANGTETTVATGIRATSLAFQGVALPVPEPSEYALIALGFAGLATFVNKKKRIA